MQRGEQQLGRKVLKSAAFAAAGMLLLSPVLVPAMAASFVDKNVASSDWLTRFTPAGVDSRLAAKAAERNAMRKASFPFTPAGLDGQHNKTITVAARADLQLSSNAVSVRSAIDRLEAGTGSTLRLNNSNYQLTAAKGWQAFKTPAATIAPDQPRLDKLVGNGNFRLEGPASAKPSRFNTDVKVGKVGNAAPNPRGNAAAGDYAFNVGGSFSISRRIDVTAGVRYASERDRVAPAAVTKPDSEAVYVGTKIRF